MNGVLLIDKEKGKISHSIVKEARKIFPSIKIGHVGTLDPIATGLLPLMLGSANRLHAYLIKGTKIYEGTIYLGRSTDTYDSEGETVQYKEIKKINPQRIEEIIPQFVGLISQKPPPYSAVKINGKPLYKYAREGKDIDIPSRKVTVYSIDIIGLEGNLLSIKVACSAGTYIRTLANDIGDMLGCGAHLSSLKRIRIGEFHLDNAIEIDSIYEQKTELMKHPAFVPIDSLMQGIEYYKIKDKSEALGFVSGSAITTTGETINSDEVLKIPLYPETINSLVRVIYDEKLLGIGVRSVLNIHPKTVLVGREQFV